MNRKELASIIKAAREKKKLSTDEFAKIYGTSAPGVSRLESGRQNICIDTLCKVASALNMELEIKFKPKKD